MAFGKVQQKTLDDLVALYQRSPDIIRLQINILPERVPTREFGSGMGIVVTPYECYEEADYALRCQWVANCQYEHTALEQAIARYLVEAGAPREKVRLRRGHPAKEIRKAHELKSQTAQE